jgi:hypothetical protein
MADFEAFKVGPNFASDWLSQLANEHAKRQKFEQYLRFIQTKQ